MITVSINHGELRILTAENTLLWEGKPLGKTVLNASVVPDSDELIVLFDYMDFSTRIAENLIRMRLDQMVVWQAKIPSMGTDDAWVAFELEPELLATTYSGWLYTVEIRTGGVISRTFVK